MRLLRSNLFFCTVVLVSAFAEDPLQITSIKDNGGLVTRAGSTGWKVEFQLAGRDLTDEGMESVGQLQDIVYLNLRDTKVTSSGLKHLQGMSKLKRLNLERTDIDDSGIVNLKNLNQLEYLNLYSTKITDEALESLKGLKNLRQLYVWQTGVTDQGVSQLEKALPGLKVVRGVDLNKVVAVKKPPKKPVEDLKWIAATGELPPRSKTGSSTEIIFINKMSQKVKIYWVQYGGELQLYGELEPGGTREQHTFSDASWLITDEEEMHLGYFRTTQKIGKALIPKI